MTFVGWCVSSGSVSGLDVSDVLPEIKIMRAPASIREGFRLSFYSALAKVPKVAKYDWMDSNGIWQKEWMPSPSGHGYTQVDVVGVTDQIAALTVQGWQYYLFTGPLLPISGGTTSLISYAGGGDWWVHPQVLAKIQETVQPGLIILRMTEKVGNRTYNVIRIQTEDANSRQVLSYELESGYLIYKAGLVEGNEGVTLYQASFTGARQVRLPWGGGVLPGWVRHIQRLEYEGSYTAATPGSNPLTLPLTGILDNFRTDTGFCVYVQTVTLGSIFGLPPTVEKTTLVTGVNHLSGLFLPPAAFATLKVGQEIDTDDVTDARMEVAYVGPLENGRPGATIRTSIGQVFWAETSFDAATGVAVELRGYNVPSTFYYTATEMRLTTLPPDVPAPPRLIVAFDAATGTVVVSCSAEAGRRLTLYVSTDGARTWTPVAGQEDRETDGTPQVYEVRPPTGAALFLASVR